MTVKEKALADKGLKIQGLSKFFKFSSLGSGLLFAATSVGTSHLVQSTRARGYDTYLGKE